MSVIYHFTTAAAAMQNLITKGNSYADASITMKRLGDMNRGQSYENRGLSMMQHEMKKTNGGNLASAVFISDRHSEVILAQTHTKTDTLPDGSTYL